MTRSKATVIFLYSAGPVIQAEIHVHVDDIGISVILTLTGDNLWDFSQLVLEFPVKPGII